MRRQPVAFALIDAAFLADSKWRALRRRLPEPRDFNSAVGAWLIVLTAARRNGLPEVNAAEEAEDPTFLPDLVAVGLLVETGMPDKPFKAWAPARPRYQSDIAPKVTDAPSATKTPEVLPGAPSTPFTSLQLTSLEDGGVQGGWDEPEAEAVTWLAGHGCALMPHSGYYRHLVLMVESHGINAVIGMFDRLATAGTKAGDVKGYVFAARDALDKQTRPNLAELEREDRAEEIERNSRRGVEATQRYLQELRSVGERKPA